MIVFVCAANVGRSQVAEGIAKKIGLNAISCAAVEARKEKYNGKPDKEIANLLYKKYNVDISNQEIFYPNDLKDKILSAKEIIFLFDPDKIKKIDKEVLIDNMPLWKFLKNVGKEYKKVSIPDPYEKGSSEKELIIDKIYKFIKNKYDK